jgi:uridine kinase
MDDLYEGWADGPDGGAERLYSQVLAPLAAGSTGYYQRYDWATGAWADGQVVPHAPVIVIEGCGAGARGIDAVAHLLIWIEADDAERLRRGLARDGAHLREQWLAWMAAESAHYIREGTRERADVRFKS